MPISDHKILEQAIYSDNPYKDGAMLYRKIEEGLWVIGTYFNVKQNIISKALYDSDFPSEYYFLSFSVFEYGFQTNHGLNQFASLKSTTCTFYKPRTEVTTYFYEGTNGIFFNIVFSKDWVKRNLTFKNKEIEHNILNFLNNETGFINWLDIVKNADELINDWWNKLKEEKEGKFDTDYLKLKVKAVISDFFVNAFEDNRLKMYEPLRNPDYANVAKAEKIILQNLNAPFVGVNNIAKAVNVSPTKLKMIFRSVFGFSMLQYHKEKNMLLAMQLIRNSDMQIKYIASITGYESAGKFSATFKKRFGILPTQMRSN
jgi:AraC-like DNA-binding protein